MASNALVAAGLCIASGENADEVLTALQSLQGAPGRLEKVASAMARLSSWTMRTSPTRLKKCLRRCVR